MVVMFYKVATNTDLANTEPLLLGKYRVEFLQVSGYIFVDRSIYITLFYVCFCLKTPYLIYSWVINTELQDTGTITRAWTKLI